MPSLQRFALATLAAALLAAPVSGQEPPPKVPPPEDVPWPEKGGGKAGPATLGPVQENRGNTPAKARDEALYWLARHQGKDGGWGASGFGACCVERSCPGPGRAEYSVGVTGLATLAFLRNGVVPGDAAEGNAVGRALAFLAAAQGEDGCIGDRKVQHNVYNHAAATLALCEAWGRTKDPALAAVARRALDWNRKAQNPYMAWRYAPRGLDNDTSVTAWMVLALRAGKDAGLEVEDRVFEGALEWVVRMTDPETGRTGYATRGGPPARPTEMEGKFPPAQVESMTASGLLVRFLGGQDRKVDAVARGTALLLAKAPVWDEPSGSIDFYYWFHGTEALARGDRDAARKWGKALEKALVPWQRGEKDGCARGSWDPVDPWAPDGGRVYATALGALMVERLAPPKKQ